MRFEEIVRGPDAVLAGLRKHGGRVAAREYIPFAAWIAAWAIITAAVGLAHSIILLAANGFVQSIRSLILMQSFDAVSARLHGTAEARARARRLALQVDAAALLGSLAILLPVAIGMRAIGLAELAAMMLIISIGLPARTPGIIALDRRNIGTVWRVGSAATLLGGATIIYLLEMEWTWAALAVATREWGGLAAAWLLGGRRPATIDNLPDLRFDEIASRTSYAARRRLVYRVSKVALTVLGPVGSIMARTGRAGGLDGRLARKLKLSPLTVGLLAAGCSTTAVAILLLGREPAALLAASVMARLACASLSVLIWWRWGDEAPQSDLLDDDI